MILIPAYLVLVGCFSEGGGVEFGSTVDYAKTRIVPLGTGIANGSSFLYIEVHSINSNDTVNANWVPELSVVTGLSTVVHNCNPTDAAGVARCAITSTMPGIKTLNIDNAFGDIVIQEDVEFTMPVLSLSLMSNVPGSNIVNTSGGYQISASLSSLQAPLRYVDGSGHVVYSTVQGVVLSEDF